MLLPTWGGAMRNKKEKHDKPDTKPDNAAAGSRRRFLKQGAALVTGAAAAGLAQRVAA